MEAHDICDSLAHETEGVRACVVLDLDTGFTLLSSRRAVVDPAEVRGVVRIACLICQNKLLGRYAAALNPPRPADGLIREAHVSTTDAHIFMAALPNLPNALLICATDKTMNIGFGWIAVHRAIERLAGVPPESLAVPLAEPEQDAAAEPEPDAAAPEQRTAPGPQPRAAREPERPPARTPPPRTPAPAPAPRRADTQPRSRARQTPSAGSTAAAPASPQVRGPRPGPAAAPETRPAAAREPVSEPPEPPATPEPPPRQARLGARAGFGARPPKDRTKR